MSLTVREKIIRQFMTRLSVITTLNGYGTDLGTKVIRARRSIDDNELPVSVLWPGPETAKEIYGITQCSMMLRVEGLALFGSENPSEVSERILGDLIKCVMAKTWTRDPELVTDIYYREGGTETYPEEGQVAVGAYADFAVTYETDLGETEYEPEGEISETVGLSGSKAGEIEE
jgi:hypothetical protein